ncbi:MAG: SDR family oxidoreductase [Candidatus Aminicenantes bacterium]|nr:SDR family oxidoreductase [Candidatus Aminicenantes bacterium]
MSKTTFRTALITGASAGLGAEYARRLAAAGTNLVLVARRLARLDDLARELREKHAVTVETLQADLATSDGIDRVEHRLAGDETLDLLVNNAGFTGGKSFVERDAAVHMDMVQVHVATTVRLSRAVLPGMVSRGRGAIINVASIAAWSAFSGPMYSGTKAFLVMFSENLQSELLGTGVCVQALCPGMTHTEFHEVANIDKAIVPKPFWMTAEEVVRISLRRLGRGVVCVPGWKNKVIAFLMRCPLTAAGIRAFSRLPAVRKRANR